MTMNKETALKLTKQAISQYLEYEEYLLDDYRYFIYAKDKTYDSDDMLNISLAQRKSLLRKADLILLDTACDAMYWISKRATQAQLTDAFGSTKDTNAISIEEYLKKITKD